MANEGREVTEANEKLRTEELEQRDGQEDLNGTDSLATLTAERDGYLDQLQRTMAEFANYRRRVDQERARARQLASRGILTQLLPLKDDLQRALANVPAEQLETSWVQGVQFIEQKLSALLEREGVTEIEAIGQPFDPSVHEAVATVDGSTQNVVTEVFQPGYKLGDQVLRPAMVRVGDRPEFQA
jgi:molecular chaperone GrpE